MTGPRRGVTRPQDSIPYGAGVDWAIAEVNRLGITSARALRDVPGDDKPRCIASALEAAVSSGRVVRVFRANYARLDVAAALLRALKSCGVKIEGEP